MHTKRIERGARWLDKQEPGWFKKIDIYHLDPASNSRCVLGQVFGSFKDVMTRRYLAINPRHLPLAIASVLLYPPNWLMIRFSISHGFAIGVETDQEWRCAWAREVEKRKQAARQEKLYVPQEWVTEEVLAHN